MIKRGSYTAALDATVRLAAELIVAAIPAKYEECVVSDKSVDWLRIRARGAIERVQGATLGAADLEAHRLLSAWLNGLGSYRIGSIRAKCRRLEWLDLKAGSNTP